jgi:hypothetical protein
LTFTWNGDVGVLRERGQTQQELDHGEGVDVVYESADNIELPDAADALNGGFAQELADHLEGASGGVQSGARGIDGENTQVVVEKELMSLSGRGGEHFLKVSAEERVAHAGRAAQASAKSVASAQSVERCAMKMCAPEEAKQAFAKLLVAQNRAVNDF